MTVGMTDGILVAYLVVLLVETMGGRTAEKLAVQTVASMVALWVGKTAEKMARKKVVA